MTPDLYALTAVTFALLFLEWTVNRGPGVADFAASRPLCLIP